MKDISTLFSGTLDLRRINRTASFGDSSWTGAAAETEETVVVNMASTPAIERRNFLIQLKRMHRLPHSNDFLPGSDFSGSKVPGVFGGKTDSTPG